MLVSEHDVDIWCLSWPWALGLEISQELVFEGYFSFSLPDSQNVLQSWSKQWLRAKFAIFYFPLGGEEIGFASVVWKLSWWVVSTPPIPLGAVSTQHRWSRAETRSSQLTCSSIAAAGLTAVSPGYWLLWLNALRKSWSKFVYATALKMCILIFAVDSGPVKAMG